MRKLLLPDEAADTIYDIDLHSLWERGYRYMIIDIDNTITAWNQHQINPRLEQWILEAKEKGFHICLLSNNTQLKVQRFASDLGVLAAPMGGKPSSRAFQSALTTLQSNASNTLVIGDQVFTDILGGNRAGLYTILVEPIDRNEFIGTRFTRLMERFIAGRKKRS